MINYALFIAFVILSGGVLLQTKKTYHTKSVKDISAAEVALRFVASIILLLKFFYTADSYLIVGQAIFTLIYLGYFLLVLKYSFFIHR